MIESVLGVTICRLIIYLCVRARTVLLEQIRQGDIKQELMKTSIKEVNVIVEMFPKLYEESLCFILDMFP